MTFTNISLDPGGTYIARTANGWFWYWAPKIHKWIVLSDGEESTEEN